MEKTGKAFNLISKIIYIILGVIWVVSTLLCFWIDYIGVVEILLAVLMMASIVMGVIRLSNGKYKLGDALFILVIQLVYFIIYFIVENKNGAFLKGGIILPSLITIVLGVLNFPVVYKNQNVQENAKLSTTLDMLIKVLYIIAAAVWVIGSIYVFCRMKSGLRPAGVQIIVYFVPLLVMLVIMGIGFYCLMKDKRSVLNALIIMILPWAETIITFGKAKYHNDSLGDTILIGYCFPSMAVGLLGAIIVLLMIIRKKYSK